MHFNPRLFIFGFISLGLTAYILLSAYAVIFVQPLPFISALSLAKSTHLITTIAKNEDASIAYSPPSSSSQANQNLQLLKIPKNQTRLNLTKAITKQGELFAKPDEGQYLFLLNNNTGKLLDIVIYADKSWSAIAHPEALLVGDNMFIQSDTNIQYLFRIVDKKVMSVTDIYVPDPSNEVGLILIIEDPKSSTASVFQGKLIDSLGVNQ